jgi:hypothetical protein
MIVAYVPNLFDRSRFGAGVRFVEDPAQAMAFEPDLILVDLDRCPAEVLGDFCTGDIPVIGFGPHVDSDGYDRAIRAGFTEVLARSVFFKRLPRLLEQPEGRPDRR